MKIYFLIQNLEGGGAERVVVNILNNLNESEFEKELVLIENRGKYLDTLNKKIRIKIFSNILKDRRLNFVLNFFKALTFLFFKKDKDIIFTQYHPGKLLSFFIPIFFRNEKIIYRETNIPQEINDVNKNSVKLLDKIFYKYGIKNFTKIIVQSLDMEKMILKIDNSLKEKLILINNPVDIEFIEKKILNQEVRKEKDVVNLISIGRLNKQKGYDLLIETLGKMKEKNFILKILGTGSEEESLKKLVKEKHLDKKVLFLGFKTNPYKYLINSDFYISSSRFEGFPNAVLEAHACGIPVIANNYNGGINEIIISGINGEIIDIVNVKKFITSLEKKYDSEKIKQTVKERYSSKIIIKKYEDLFKDVRKY